MFSERAIYFVGFTWPRFVQTSQGVVLILDKMTSISLYYMDTVLFLRLLQLHWFLRHDFEGQPHQASTAVVCQLKSRTTSKPYGRRSYSLRRSPVGVGRIVVVCVAVTTGSGIRLTRGVYSFFFDDHVQRDLLAEVEVVPVLGASLGCGLREKGQADTLCHRFENLECGSSVELAKEPSCGVADASLPSCGDVPSGAASGSGSGSGSTGVSPSLSLNCISSLSFKLRTLLRSQSVTLNCSKKPLSVRSHQQRSSMGTSFGFMSSGRFGNMEASASA